MLSKALCCWTLALQILGACLPSNAQEPGVLTHCHKLTQSNDLRYGGRKHVIRLTCWHLQQRIEHLVPFDSCVGNCYSSAPAGSCYCDDLCTKFGNCCPDFIEQCANISLCEHRCSTPYSSSLECQCNNQCWFYGNCCEDYHESCLPGSCAGRCGERNATASACQCDGACTNSNDCCEDFFDACTTIDSCENLCGARYDGKRSCQCAADCEDNGNCCNDFKQMCPNGGVIDLYSCVNQCGVKRDKCSCQANCIEEKNCCTDYEQTCNNGTSWLEDECTPDDEMVCPDGFDTPPVILFSMDGFRSSYIYRNITPNIWKLASCGVHSPYVRSVYPTKTFPNHYSIATGLYPESHGIVSNTFYDYNLNEEFSLGAPQAADSHWWGGQPIWITANTQGLISASYFWVGSDVNISGYPNYYYDFDNSVPDQDRIQQVLKWLDYPKDQRPSMITAYIEKVDGAGHSGGPNGAQVNSEIEKADETIGMLMDGLKQRKLDKCVNLVLLADHGMADRSCERLSYIDKYGIDLDTVYFHGGPVGTIGKSEDKSQWNLYNAQEIKKKLQCKGLDAHFEAYIKQEDMPKRFHHAFNDRIEDVQLVLDDEWIVGGKSGTSTTCSGGTHGWDNEYKAMQAVFVAHGSSFKRGYNTTEGFDNTEIYSLICDMLDINPAPNNGTRGSLYHMLKNPKSIIYTSSGISPKMCPYPSGNDVPSNRAGCTSCANEAENNRRLSISSDKEKEYTERHFITGIPEISTIGEDEVNYCMLTHPEYITAYDWNKKLPYYSSYVLSNMGRLMVGWSFCVRPDVRLPSDGNAPRCSDFDGTHSDDITGAFLFPPILSNYDKSDALILSNVIPVRQAFMPVWKQFAEILNNWSNMYNGIAVTVGPAFDYDYDGHADSSDVIESLAMRTDPNDPQSLPIPTHIFAMITRCKNYSRDEDIYACSTSPDKVEVLSFLIPNFKQLPCQYNERLDKWVPQTLIEHVARVRDVELLTGITFFPDWTTKAGLAQDTLLDGLRLRTRLPVFGTEWLNDFINSATPNPNLVPTPPIHTTSNGFRLAASLFLSLLPCFLAAKRFL